MGPGVHGLAGRPAPPQGGWVGIKSIVLCCPPDEIWRGIPRTTEIGADATLDSKLRRSRGKDDPSGGYDPTTFNPKAYIYCSTTGKPTHLFRTKCVSLDSV
jgi:hypothetical protein